VTVGFGMFIRPSARMEKLGSHWTNFYEVSYLIIFQKSLEKKFYQNLRRIIGTLLEDLCIFVTISR
jgi:hypothetical protein